jgi:hypothetical protein
MLPVVAVVPSSVRVTVKVRFTVVVVAGGVIVPLVAITPGSLEVAIVIVKPGIVGMVRLVAPALGVGTEVEVIALATCPAEAWVSV